MKIALVGATGATGSQVLSLGLAEGHTFRVLVRDPQKLTAIAGHIDVIKGDILSREAVQRLISPDCGAVVSTLGSIEPKTETTTFSDGMKNLLEAMRAVHVRRLLAISASGFHYDDFDTLLTRLAKPILQRFFRHTYADLARMERVIQNSDATDWTIFVPPRLTNAPARGQPRIAEGHNIKGGMQISRADLAGAMVRALADRNAFRKMLFLSN